MVNIKNKSRKMGLESTYMLNSNFTLEMCTNRTKLKTDKIQIFY